MPRRKIAFVKNYFYHVFNRGSRKQNIFLNDNDYQRFLEKTKKYKEKFKISILVYCLLPNHFHFILQQSSTIPISNFLHSVTNSYGKYFNIKNELIGPLFQGRFRAKLIESEEYLLHLSRYIHLNPSPFLSSKEKFSNYPYSSYQFYTGTGKIDKENIVNKEIILSYFSKTQPYLSYKSFVEGKEKDFENISHLILE